LFGSVPVQGPPNAAWQQGCKAVLLRLFERQQALCQALTSFLVNGVAAVAVFTSLGQDVSIPDFSRLEAGVAAAQKLKY